VLRKCRRRFSASSTETHDAWLALNEILINKGLSFDTSKYSNVFEVKVQWEGSVKPKIHEIITVKKDGNGEVDPPGKMSSILSGVDSVTGGRGFQLVFGVKSVTDAVYAMDVTMNYDPKLLEFKAATSLRN